MSNDIFSFIYSLAPTLATVATLIGTIVTILYIFPLESLDKKINEIWVILNQISESSLSREPLNRDDLSDFQNLLQQYQVFNKDLDILQRRHELRQKYIPGVIDGVYFFIVITALMYFWAWCLISYSVIADLNIPINIFLAIILIGISIYIYFHFRECKIVCVNRYCMNLLYAPYWGKQR